MDQNNEEYMEKIKGAIVGFSDYEKTILIDLFGMDDGINKSSEEIQQKYCIEKDELNKLIARCFREILLNNRNKNFKLKDYLD